MHNKAVFIELESMWMVVIGIQSCGRLRIYMGIACMQMLGSGPSHVMSE
jgi:hypothetical protein